MRYIASKDRRLLLRLRQRAYKERYVYPLHHFLRFEGRRQEHFPVDGRLLYWQRSGEVHARRYIRQSVYYIGLAKELDIPILVTQLDEHIRGAIEKQLHVNDLKFMFDYLPAKHHYRQLAVEVISDAIDNKKVRIWPGFQQLRLENKAYRDDIKAFRDMVHGPERRVARKEAWLKVKAERDTAWQIRHEQNEKERTERLVAEAAWRNEQAREYALRRVREGGRGAARALPGRIEGVSGGWLNILHQDTPPYSTNVVESSATSGSPAPTSGTTETTSTSTLTTVNLSIAAVLAKDDVKNENDKANNKNRGLKVIPAGTEKAKKKGLRITEYENNMQWSSKATSTEKGKEGQPKVAVDEKDKKTNEGHPPVTTRKRK